MDNEERFLRMAEMFARHICENAVWEGDTCNWVGHIGVYRDERYIWQPNHLGWDFYSGTTGIAYFLSKLSRLTSEKSFKKTAEGAIRFALQNIATIPSFAKMSFYTGITGIAYTLLELSEAFHNENLRQEAFHLLASLSLIPIETQNVDLLHGIAGTICAFVEIFERYQDKACIDFALQLGEHLQALAQKREIGWSWNTLGIDSAFPLQRDDLVGLAHGASGIASALLQLYACTHDVRWKEAAEQGFRYERHWYCPTNENWLDLRDNQYFTPEQQSNDMYHIQWCYGASGIGLARLRAYEILQEEIYKEEAEAALKTTIRDIEAFPRNQQPNYCQCHGQAGNADLLICAHKVLKDSTYQYIADKVGDQGISLYGHNPLAWPLGIPKETPNLMLGTSGIGSFYLRLANPALIPSILLI